ncbi:MAG: lipid-A-disaccharide synthase [Alphaproteobacteria bacterium]|nr:lipid-A-disaccharide synthase [Alphaproteobacteria bacterium]
MTAEPPLIFVIAGEPSGDQLGGALMGALSALTEERARFAGIGGEAMRAAGLDSLFPMTELSLMGAAELIPHIPKLIGRIKLTVETIRRLRPAAVVTIDAPAFCLRIGRRVGGLSFPRIHYVAPQAWAWRPGRAREYSRAFDRLLALLPFEPDFFAKYGLDCRFVGHPVIESGAGQGDGPAFRARHGIVPDARVLCVLPGSRNGEVSRLLPVFAEAVARLAGSVPGLTAVLPTVPAVAERVAAAAATWRVPTVVVRDVREKFDAFAAADAALAASGTVALELALSGTPSVIAYRLNPVSAFVARRLILVSHAALPNIIAGRTVMPEMIQEDCRPDRLASEVARLLQDPPAWEAQRIGAREVAEQLGRGGEPPSRRAATAVLDAIADWQRR